jgi:hypothetical protein
LKVDPLGAHCQIPPAPLAPPIKAANNNQLAAFFIGKSIAYALASYRELH